MSATVQSPSDERSTAAVIGSWIALVLLVAVLALANWGIAIAALLGIAVGAGMRRFGWRNTLGSIYVATGIVIVIGVAVVLVWAVLNFGGFQAPRPVTGVTARYIGSAALESSDRWQITDGYTVDQGVVQRVTAELRRDAGGAKRTAITERRVARLITASFVAAGWHLARRVDSADVYEHRRAVAVQLRHWPLKTINTIEIPQISLKGRFDFVYLASGETSELHLLTPHDAIGETTPKAKSREPRLGEALDEELVVPAAVGSTRMEVVNPIARNPFGRAVQNITFWSAAKWLVFALFALFSGQLKKHVFEPTVGKLLRRLKLSRLPAEKAA